MLTFWFLISMLLWFVLGTSVWYNFIWNRKTTREAGIKIRTMYVLSYFILAGPVGFLYLMLSPLIRKPQ